MNALLTIEMDNAAFEARHTNTRGTVPQADGNELARILRALAEQVEHIGLVTGDAFIPYDINGNRVGALRVTA